MFFPRHKVRFYDDCKSHHEEHNITGRDVTPDTVSEKIQPGDTIYVELMKISHFVQHAMPKIDVPNVVLISGQKKLDFVWTREEFDLIVNHGNISHWFLMNMDVYAQDPDHEKVGTFT